MLLASPVVDVAPESTLEVPCVVLQRVAACCSVLQGVVVCCSVLQRVAVLASPVVDVTP